MAEILGLASSIITIVEVAGKLGTNTIRLKRLWDEVQDVPASIQRCIEQLEILAPAIEEMDDEFEKTRKMVQNDSAAKRSLECSRKAVEALDSLVRDMEAQINTATTSRRLAAQLKVRIKRDVIEDHQQRLTSALQLLSLSQQTYLIALSRAQPEIIISEMRKWRDSESQTQFSISPKDKQATQGKRPQKGQNVDFPDHVKSPASRDPSFWSVKRPLPQRQPGLLGSFTFQSYEVVENPSIHYTPEKARFFRARMQMPWFTQRSWDLSVLRASTGWTFQLNTWNIRPWDADIFRAVRDGKFEIIVESLKSKGASVYDMNPSGRTLLDIAVLYRQIQSIKALTLMGMRFSDIESGYTTAFIWNWIWDEPELSSSMELARIWKAETGGIQEEHWEQPMLVLAFWAVPDPHNLLIEPRSIRQAIASFGWSSIGPAVALALLKDGLAVPTDFPPYICSSKPDDICSCYHENLIYQYFHALLNNDRSFNDWRCLARKILLGVSPLDIVHPHDGAFWNLTSLLEALWKRQFPLLPFERWIQNAMALWLEDLVSASINLEDYMSLEILYSRECYKNEVEIQPGARLPEFGPALVIMSVGPRADDWSFLWDPCVEELSGEFWTTVENIERRIPGAWVDESNEVFGCLMGEPDLCEARKFAKYHHDKNRSNTIEETSEKEHTKHMRPQGEEWPEKKDVENLGVRGMMTCSPYLIEGE